MTDTDPDAGGALRGTGCPICGRSIESYEVHYVYDGDGRLDRDANRWVLHPCDHAMTRSAWDAQGDRDGLGRDDQAAPVRSA